MAVGDNDGEHFVSRFLDDFCCLVSRVLTSSSCKSAHLVPAPPSTRSTTSSSASPPAGVEVMVRLMNEARPRVGGGGGGGGGDFPTESAVFLLRLRSLLAGYLNREHRPHGGTSLVKAVGAKRRSEGQSGGGAQCQSTPSCDAPQRNTLQQIYQHSSNTVVGNVKKLRGLNRKAITTKEAECQTESVDISVCNKEMPLRPLPLIRSTDSGAVAGGDILLGDVQGRLALLLQHHTTDSIIGLKHILTGTHKGFTKECDLCIQTHYIKGIRRELEEEQNRLHRECSSEPGVKEEQQLHYLEIVQVLERLGMAVASEECRKVVIEEFNDGSKECDADNKRLSTDCTFINDPVTVFGRSGVGFVSKLVIQNVQCFLSVLTTIDSSPARWNYLEKVLFFADSESPVPTVPMEMDGSPSRGSTDMDMNKTPSQERSESVKACDMDDYEGDDGPRRTRRSTELHWQARDHIVQSLMRKFRPCLAYEEVGRLEVACDERGVW